MKKYSEHIALNVFVARLLYWITLYWAGAEVTESVPGVLCLCGSCIQFIYSKGLKIQFSVLDGVAFISKH